MTKFYDAYYQWAEDELQWDWWDWKYEELVTAFDAIGLDVDAGHISFDEYHLSIEKGTVNRVLDFIKALGFTSDLFILNEATVNPDNIEITLGRYGVDVSRTNYQSFHNESGLFTQMSEDEYDEEVHTADWSGLESAAREKITDMCLDAHKELMTYQEDATSEESFKRWIKDYPADAKEIYGLRGKRAKKIKQNTV